MNSTSNHSSQLQSYSSPMVSNFQRVSTHSWRFVPVQSLLTERALCGHQRMKFFTLILQNIGAAWEVEKCQKNCLHGQTRSCTTAVKWSFSDTQKMCSVWGEARCEQGQMSVWKPPTRSLISDTPKLAFVLPFLHYLCDPGTRVCTFIDFEIKANLHAS